MMCSAAPIAPTLAAVVLSLRECGKWCSDDPRGGGGGLSGGRGSAVATGGDLLDAASDVSPRVLCELPYAKLLVAAMSYMAASEEIAKALVAALTNCARSVAAAVGGGATAKPTCVDELPKRARHCDVYLPVVLARRGCACGHECRRRSPRCGSPLSMRAMIR